MGTTEQLVAGPGLASVMVELGIGGRLLGELTGDWAIVEVTPGLPLKRLNETILTVAARTGEVAIGTFVEDSDYAYASACANQTFQAHLLFNAHDAADYREGVWAQAVVGLDKDHDWIARQAARFATWSLAAPTSISAERIAELLRSRWDFAEDAVTVLRSELGLGLTPSAGIMSLEGALHIFDGPRRVGTDLVDWSKTRFVVGVGSDFVGVWDRSSAGPPVMRLGIRQLEYAMKEAWRMENAKGPSQSQP
jgi:hypothetical protein